MNTIKRYIYNGINIEVIPQEEPTFPKTIRPVSKTSAIAFFISALILGVQLDAGSSANPAVVILMIMSSISILTDVYKDQLIYIRKKITRRRKSR